MNALTVAALAFAQYLALQCDSPWRELAWFAAHLAGGFAFGKESRHAFWGGVAVFALGLCVLVSNKIECHFTGVLLVVVLLLCIRAQYFELGCALISFAASFVACAKVPTASVVQQFFYGAAAAVLTNFVVCCGEFALTSLW
jgi:hypothetical protein